MKLTYMLAKTFLLASLLGGTYLTSLATEPDENDEDIRTGPLDLSDDGSVPYDDTFVSADDGEEEEPRIAIPDFINEEANRIDFNGADWSHLRRNLGACDTDPFTIIHIGDSHIQADFATAATRRLLQYDYGDAGRGLITPLKISGTNQPDDYEFSSHDLWHSLKLMKKPWKTEMGFTGTSISPDRRSSRLTIGLKPGDEDYSPFSSLTIFHHGRLKINDITTSDGTRPEYIAIPSRDYTEIEFAEPQSQVELTLTGAGDLAVFGASLSGQRPGIFYHTIGNNGATYNVYNSIPSMGEGIYPLQPDLVVISLGTNEAFGKVNHTTLYDNIDALVSDIRRTNPGAEILLVTPMECQKSEYRTTTKHQAVGTRKGKKGKKSRRTVNKRVRVRTGAYTVNPSVASVRDIIKSYGKDHGIAVYDWYEVAGGAGSSLKWVADGLFSKDRVHHSRKGYLLQGELLYEALKEAIDPGETTAASRRLPSLAPIE